MPFDFDTGTHGSGQRAAAASSLHNVIYELGDGGTSSVLRLDLRGGAPIGRNDVYFLPEEVDSVRLNKVADSEFSPVYQGYNNPLVPIISTLRYYSSVENLNNPSSC
ncbi:hypothetical protein HYV80_05105 [Candidatus Woesearchaeota archaeon]|nr:hypothetical protein [Candidatus Woesearchaeota archaeon]